MYAQRDVIGSKLGTKLGIKLKNKSGRKSREQNIPLTQGQNSWTNKIRSTWQVKLVAQP